MSILPKFKLAVLLLLLFSICLQGCYRQKINKQSGLSIISTIPSNTDFYYIFDLTKFKNQKLSTTDISRLIYTFKDLLPENLISLENKLQFLGRLDINLVDKINSGSVYIKNNQFYSCIEAKSDTEILLLKTAINNSNNSIAIYSNENNLRLFITQKDNQNFDSLRIKCFSTTDNREVNLTKKITDALNDTKTYGLGFVSANQINTSLPNNELSIGEVTIHQTLDKTNKTIISNNFITKNSNQKILIDTIKSTAIYHPVSNIFSNIKLDSNLSIYLPKSFIELFFKGALFEADPDQQIFFNSILDKFQHIDFSTIVLNKGKKDAMFPEMTILLTSKDPSITYLSIQNLIQELISENIPMSNWLEKETFGVRFKYVQFPFGLGIYIAKNNQDVVISSTEDSLIQLMTNKELSLRKFITEKGFDNFGNTAFSIYFDSARVANLIETFQEPLSIFSNGQSLLNNQQIGFLKQYSLGTISISSNDDTIDFVFEYLPSYSRS